MRTILKLLRGALGLLLAAIATVVALPIIGAIALLQTLGLLERGRGCTPSELAADLRALAAGTLDDGGCDELECVPLKDKRLESIRQKILGLPYNLTDSDRAKLLRLADEAAELSPLQEKS